MTKFITPQTINMLRIRGVLAKIGVSRASFYKGIAAGVWPKPISLGGRMVAWPEFEIDVILCARVAGKPDGEVKEVVQQLEAQRPELLAA